LHNSQAWYWTYLANVNIAINGWPKFGYIGHYWSLAIEEQFYIFWPLLVFLFKRRSLMMICGSCILMAFGIRLAFCFLSADPYPATFVLTPARMDALAVGALIALSVRSEATRALMYRWAGKVLMITGILLAGIFLWRRGLRDFDPVVYTIGYSLISGFFGALLILAIESYRDAFLNKIFSSRILMFLGRYSYALYVFHPLVIKLFQKHQFSTKLFPGLAGSQLPGQLVYSTLVVGSAIIISLLSWFLWESRFLRLKRYCAYRE
jgi:peptidoglycan/LPS O-acetylase OafA/YrhL